MSLRTIGSAVWEWLSTRCRTECVIPTGRMSIANSQPRSRLLAPGTLAEAIDLLASNPEAWNGRIEKAGPVASDKNHSDVRYARWPDRPWRLNSNGSSSRS